MEIKIIANVEMMGASEDRQKNIVEIKEELSKSLCVREREDGNLYVYREVKEKKK